ncbi:MAG TPA: hypothetical protein VJK51_05755 [Candidatus Nanoarchaeia archaeon]|nr:hypothetical protein [Candidatus Nanoarchaeia archaeon]
MATTIQISDNVKTVLDRMKMIERETYNDVIERMIEDDLEVNEKTRQEIEEARKGKSISHAEVKKRLGL